MRARLWVLLLGVGCTGAGKPPTMTSTTTFDHGTATGPATTMTVGASGGALVSADGRMTLTVPAGALTADTMLSVTPITNTVPLGIQSAYRLGPEGTTFAKPATVTFTFGAADTMGSSTDALNIGYQDSSGAWHAYATPTVDTGASTVSVSTSHLSDWSLVLGWQITPGNATVQATASVALTLRFCEPETFDDGSGVELSGLVYKCDIDDDLPHLVNVSGWSVNGTAGGSASDGTVSGAGKMATYTAPAAAPVGNPVAVSVQFAGAHKGGTQLAVSNVTIGGMGWSGTISWSLAGTVMTTDPMYMKTYTGTGSGSATIAPGAVAELLTVPAITETYNYDYDEVYTNNYGAQGCTHMVSQTRTEKLTGMSSDASSIVALAAGDQTTTGLQISLSLPEGTTTGDMKTVGTDAVTGTGCETPAPTNLDDPETGSLPDDTLMFTIISTNPTMLSGTANVHFDDMPPRDYTVTYSLQR